MIKIKIFIQRDNEVVIRLPKNLVESVVSRNKTKRTTSRSLLNRLCKAISPETWRGKDSYMMTAGGSVCRIAESGHVEFLTASESIEANWHFYHHVC